MSPMKARVGVVYQNLIIGSITGLMVGINVRVVLIRFGNLDIVWILFFLIGPLMGLLSGRERQRLEKLKEEKFSLAKNLDKIQTALTRSKKKYQLLVEHANDAIFVTTLDGRFLLFNEATCLFSGYSRNELKDMALNDLRVDDSVDEDNQGAWLDNGVCRYEEKWKNKNGNIVWLEMNGRWIHFGGQRLVLFVGRDIQRQKEIHGNEKLTEMRGYLQNQVLETARVQQNLYRTAFTPLNQAMKMVQSLRKSHPEQEERFSEVFRSWAVNRKMLQTLASKNERDLSATSSSWDLNDMIMQELYYLESLTDTDRFVARTTLSPDMPMVYGLGRDFSTMLGPLFLAAFRSVENSEMFEFSVLSRVLNEHILVELKLKDSRDLLTHIDRAFYPFSSDKDAPDPSEGIGWKICCGLFEMVGATIDLMDEDGPDAVIRIRLSAASGGPDVSRKAVIKKETGKTLII